MVIACYSITYSFKVFADNEQIEPKKIKDKEHEKLFSALNTYLGKFMDKYEWIHMAFFKVDVENYIYRVLFKQELLENVQNMIDTFSKNTFIIEQEYLDDIKWKTIKLCFD